MDNAKTIAVECKLKIKIGETEIEVTRDEAEAIYGQLYYVLGKANIIINQPYYYNWPVYGVEVTGKTGR